MSKYLEQLSLLKAQIERLGLNWTIHRNFKFGIWSIEDNVTHDTYQRGTLKELYFFINGMKLMYDIKQKEINDLNEEIKHLNQSLSDSFSLVESFNRT